MERTTERPTAADFMRNTANWLDAHGCTYDVLVSGPLGEALTRAQIEALAGDSDAVDDLAHALREYAHAIENTTPYAAPSPE